MMTILCISDWSSIISTTIASLAGLLGVCLSFHQWRKEKKLQREIEREELLTKLVGRCVGTLDYVVLQYRKFKLSFEKDNTNLDTEWKQLQICVEPLVQEAEEICNEAELKICDVKVINSLKELDNAFIALIEGCSKESTDISALLDEYSDKKKSFMKIANEHLQSIKGSMQI